MKFVCLTERYRHFRGLLFMNHQPTDVKDKATIMALENHPDFRKAEDEKEVKAPTEKVLKVLKVLIPDVCPKCGKTVKRGKFMHAKYCKGLK